jgi:hypothetical protein
MGNRNLRIVGMEVKGGKSPAAFGATLFTKEG